MQPKTWVIIGALAAVSILVLFINGPAGIAIAIVVILGSAIHSVHEKRESGPYIKRVAAADFKPILGHEFGIRISQNEHRRGMNPRPTTYAVIDGIRTKVFPGEIYEDDGGLVITVSPEPLDIIVEIRG